MNEFQKIREVHYCAQHICASVGGVVWFDPDSLKDVVGAEKLTYDEYLDVQFTSIGKVKDTFTMSIFNYGLGYKGEIERMTKNNICFKRIFIIGMYSDGVMFDEKEDHVWMDKKGFEDYNVGDCVSFSAEVYRYLKTGNGKIIDYSLRNPQGIKKVEPYELPTDEEIFRQYMREVKCEVCYLNGHCNRNFCILSNK